MKKATSDKSDPEIKVTIVDIEEGSPDPSISRSKRCCNNFTSLLRRSYHRRNKSEESPWPKLVRRTLYLITTALIFGIIAYIITHSVLLALTRRLRPLPVSQNGLTKIISQWAEPGSVNPAPPSWLPNFSQDIHPKNIHSHNDYWRRVPLFEALSLGVKGVEADCHLVNGEIYVGHTSQSLRPNRTLKSLYLDPLTSILEAQNAKNGIATGSGIDGVWDVDGSIGIVLMTDLKTEGLATLDAVQAQLEPFREKGWLTHWNGTSIVPGPILHVGTGNTPFEAVLNSTYNNATYRSVFFDAPLDALSTTYNTSNSYYTSISLSHLFGHSKIPRSGLTKSQMITVKGQIEKATELGLVSRYWDIPAWPVSTRMKIWRQLEDLGVGMLNADQIDEAARWNWRWCTVLGISLC